MFRISHQDKAIQRPPLVHALLDMQLICVDNVQKVNNEHHPDTRAPKEQRQVFECRIEGLGARLGPQAARRDLGDERRQESHLLLLLLLLMLRLLHLLLRCWCGWCLGRCWCLGRRRRRWYWCLGRLLRNVGRIGHDCLRFMDSWAKVFQSSGLHLGVARQVA